MGGIEMKRSEYEIGQYLFDGKHAFIHDGYVNADGYGVIIGYYEHELRKNSGYGNWQKTGNIRPATEKEISNLLRILCITISVLNVIANLKEE